MLPTRTLEALLTNLQVFILAVFVQESPILLIYRIARLLNYQ